MLWTIIGILTIGLFGIIAFAGALAAAIALIRLLAELVLRLLLSSALALSAGVFGAAVAAHVFEIDAVLAGVILAIFFWIPATILVWRWRGPPLRSAAVDDRAAEMIAVKIGQPECHTAERDKKSGSMVPDGDEAIGLAWEDAATLAPEFAERLSVAREKCARLLWADSKGMGSANSYGRLELATLIRRHVAPLVRETRQTCDGVSTSECSELVAQMALRLEQLGNRAEELLEEERKFSSEGLALRHVHLAQRLRDSTTG